jgi:hypothetical protein
MGPTRTPPPATATRGRPRSLRHPAPSARTSSPGCRTIRNNGRPRPRSIDRHPHSRRWPRLSRGRCRKCLPKLGGGGCWRQMSVLTGVETAGQGRLLARGGKQVPAIGQDCRRTGHPQPSRLILCRHDLPRYPDIRPGREQRCEDAIQDFRARAVRHVQDLEPHPLSPSSLVNLRASSGSRKARIATTWPWRSVSTR